MLHAMMLAGNPNYKKICKSVGSNDLVHTMKEASIVLICFDSTSCFAKVNFILFFAKNLAITKLLFRYPSLPITLNIFINRY